MAESWNLPNKILSASMQISSLVVCKTWCTCHYFARPGGRRADPGEFDILKYLKSKSPRDNHFCLNSHPWACLVHQIVSGLKKPAKVYYLGPGFHKFVKFLPVRNGPPQVHDTDNAAVSMCGLFCRMVVVRDGWLLYYPETEKKDMARRRYFNTSPKVTADTTYITYIMFLGVFIYLSGLK